MDFAWEEIDVMLQESYGLENSSGDMAGEKSDSREYS